MYEYTILTITLGGTPAGSVKIVLKYDHRKSINMIW